MNLIDLFPVLLATVALYRCDASCLRSSTFNDSCLTQEDTNHLRGLFSMIVVFHHIYQMVGCGILYPIFTRIGFLGVGFFYFVSGYGLMKRYTADSAYHKSFFRKRIPSIVLPFVLAVIIYWIFHNLQGTHHSLWDVIASIAQGRPIAANSWYMISILVCYTSFWGSIFLFRNRPSLVAWFNALFCVVYTVVCIRIGYGSEWFKSISAYPLGLLWAMYEAPVLERIKKRYYLWVVAAFGLLGGSMLAQMLYGNLSAPPAIQAVISNLTITCFVGCLILVILKLRIGNSFLAWLGRHSLEIYLYHGMFLVWARPLWTERGSVFLYFLAVLSGSLVFAYLVHPVEQWLLKACRRKPVRPAR